MNFKDKYTSSTEKEKDKKIISDDAYAIGEVIEQFMNELKVLRFTHG